MKSKFFLSTAFAAAMFATTTNATTVEPRFDGAKVSISTTNKTLKVSLIAATTEAVVVKLENTEGVELVNETVNNKASFIKNYKLDNLEVGKYRLVIKRNGSKTIQPFELTPLGIALSTADREEHLLPTVVQKGDVMTVKAFAKKGENIAVRIIGNDGFQVFEKTFSTEMLVKNFNIGNLSKGAYVVEVEADDETEYFTIIK